jgi:hypothetical protein
MERAESARLSADGGSGGDAEMLPRQLDSVTPFPRVWELTGISSFQSNDDSVWSTSARNRLEKQGLPFRQL